MRSNLMPWRLALLLAGLLALSGAAAAERSKLLDAHEVMREIMAISESSIPPSLLSRAQGIAIVPDVVKVGFIVGGRHGQGVVMVRHPETGKWGYPVFVELTGGSVGWQIGAQSSDVILVFKNRRGVIGIMDGKFTVGADAAVAAGPVGRNTAAATDANMKAEIYSYSRSRGLFAGIALDGSQISVDDAANSNYYGAGTASRAILDGDIGSAGSEAERLRAQINRLTGAR